jgi:hypothetical protein
MRPAPLLCMALLLAAGAAFGDRPNTRGTNCSLRTPPSDAVADSKDASAKVFPQASDIGARYNGCQLVWIPQGKGWTLREMSQFEKGELKIHYVAHDDMVCVYQRAELLVGDPKVCASAKELPRR